MVNSIVALLQPLEDENKRLKRLAVLAAVVSVLTAFVLMACQGPRSIHAFPASKRYATPIGQIHGQHARSVRDGPVGWADFAANR